jgi:phosphoribosylamine--glycine ligase
VVLERMLVGEEASLFVITDGTRYRILPGSQDHKRAYDADRGPNTGGMGAYSPAPVLDEALTAEVERTVVRPTLDGLREDGIPYRGLLYVGLMITAEGPQVLEYNVRFGDPETQAVLPRLDEDLGALLQAAARGELAEGTGAATRAGAAACVVAAAGDYPRSGSRGLPIEGVEAAREAGALVFHAGTAREGDRLVTAGGRVFGVVGRGADLGEALAVAYRAIAHIQFDGVRYRRDIGRRALDRVDAG